jgi:hypothetical protein
VNQKFKRGKGSGHIHNCFALALLVLSTAFARAAEDGVFVRLRLIQPEAARYYVKLGGFIHIANWHLPETTIPKGANNKPELRLPSGEFTEWFDLKAHAGKNLHKRLNRAGGIAEFPNVTAAFVVDPAATRREVEIELATEPDAAKVVKRWHEIFEGEMTSFIVSPNLADDAAQLESAAEMTERRLRWAMEATGGVRHSPKELILQTGFWGPQRSELNLKEANVLSLLGFNVVGGMRDEVRDAFPEFRSPSASHDVPLGPQISREDVRTVWEKLGKRLKHDLQSGAPYNFQDEVCCRPPIGNNEKALRGFREWLKKQAEARMSPLSKKRPLTPVPGGGEGEDLGIGSLDEAEPIETPDAFRERMKTNEPVARRLFYYTSRYRQQIATEQLMWNTEEFHRQAGAGPLSSTLVADHPYFGGTGLGMGFEQQNSAWGGWPLAMDWFDIGRRKAVDLIGIEDWLGLQFMYGPSYTWEGFQLLGFQAAIFRSASRGELPIITWITPSDERNLRLKAASALAQGAKHFYYWTYGPTATSTENYWSDQPGSYPGMAHLSRLLEFGEPIIAKGKPRRSKVALLYSLSSDLWQPFGYIHMLERRALYLALIHDHWLVDLITEEDVASGRLKDYRILYSADPCISSAAANSIKEWVRSGGTFVGTGAAGSQNEFGEPSETLSEVAGVAPGFSVRRQLGQYRTRGRLNDIPYLDHVKVGDQNFGVIGLKCSLQPTRAKVKGTFATNGGPAVIENKFGKGRAIYFATTPGISYLKNAKFVANDLAEKYPPVEQAALTRYATEAGATRLVNLSEPVVEAGIYDAPNGTALVLANFTYKPIQSLRVEVPIRSKIASVKSLEKGKIAFETVRASPALRRDGFTKLVRFTIPLGLDDLILLQ